MVRRFAVAGLEEAAQRSGCRRGLVVGALDETGQEKQGCATAGVQRQYLGCAGKVASAITTVHLAYVREHAGHALIGARQRIPGAQIADPEKSLAMGLPPGLQFRTKGQLARGHGEVRSAGKGSKGQRWYAWSWLATASPRHHLLVRRHLKTGELAFHYCFVSEGQPAGLAAKTVAAIRKSSSEEAPQSNARIGRDGRVRPLDSGVGRRRAADLLTQQPDASLRDVARAAGISPATVLDVRKRLGRGQSPVPGKPAANAARKGASGNGAEADTGG
jgi:hypothetical protein